MRKRTMVVAAATLAMLVAPAQAAGWGDFYAKVFGGVTLPNTLLYGSATPTPYALDPGLIGGVALGLHTPIEGLSLELDATMSSAGYTGWSTSLNGTTVMGNVVFTAPLTEMFSIYGGAGAGVVSVFYADPGYDATGVAAAGQVFAGASLDLAPNLSIFGEYRYQTAFGPVSVTDVVNNTYNLEFARSAVMLGIKISTD